MTLGTVNAIINPYIEAAKAFTGKRGACPILNTIACNERIAATDLETSYIAMFSTGLEGCYEPKQMDVLFAGGSTRALPLDEFPTITAESAKYGLSFDMKRLDLIELFSRAITFASKDATRYNINGVCLDNKGKSGYPRFVATDGHRLVELRTEAKDYYGAPELPSDSLILPTDGIKKLIKWLKARKSHVVISVAFSPDYARFCLPDETVYIRLIDGQFPDWRQVVPGYGECMYDLDVSFAVYADQLLAAVKEVSQVCTDKPKAVKVHLSNDHLLVSSSSAELGKLSKSLYCDYNFTDKNRVFGIAAKYLTDYLAGVEGLVTVQLSGKNKPDTEVLGAIRFTQYGTNECVMIMPVRFK